MRDGDLLDTANLKRTSTEAEAASKYARVELPGLDDDRWQASKPDWGPWRVSCDNARATPVPIRMGTFRRGPMGSQTKCEIPLCRCGGRGARCRYEREFFPQAQPWVCEIGSHRSVPSPVLLFVVFPPLVKAYT